MKASTRTLAPLLAAALLCGAPAVAAEKGQDNQSRIDTLPGSSRCLAECVVMEARCEELEKEFPACGTDDICLNEKEQCDAKCRVTAMICPLEPASRSLRG